MSAPVRKPRAASSSRPVPTLQTLAATLAVGALAAVPFAAWLFPDMPCSAPPAAGSVVASLATLQSRGALATSDAAMPATHGPCTIDAPPQELQSLGAEPRVSTTPLTEHTAATTNRVHPPGGIAMMRPDPISEHHARRADQVRPRLRSHR